MTRYVAFAVFNGSVAGLAGHERALGDRLLVILSGAKDLRAALLPEILRRLRGSG